MFDTLRRAATATADAVDLIIEFATLGEYGLEYPPGELASAIPPAAPAPTPVPARLDCELRPRGSGASTAALSCHHAVETTDWLELYRSQRRRPSLA